MGKAIAVLDKLALSYDSFASLVPEVLKPKPKSDSPLDNISPLQYWARHYLSARYIRGEGLEIGALHQPLPLYFGAKAKYIDRYNVEDLRSHYPELRNFNLVSPHYIGNGEELEPIAPESLDFLVANHFIEHTEDPIGTLERHLAKLKVGGRLFLAVPNKHHTFDRERAITPLEHLLADYNCEGRPENKEHYVDWARFVDKVPESEIEARAQKLMEEEYSIHFHVWDLDAFELMLAHIRQHLNFPFLIVERVIWRYNPFEFVYILQKT